MVQLRVLSGNKAGTELVTRHFPVRVGRSNNAALTLDDPGVWDEHFRIDFKAREGYLLHAGTDAMVSMNGEPLKSVRLRNGDILTAGSVKVQFWLAAASQRRLGYRETFTWLMVAAICAVQVALVYLLIQL